MPFSRTAAFFFLLRKYFSRNCNRGRDTHQGAKDSSAFHRLVFHLIIPTPLYTN